ncbi:MAG TPA: hypothetical protein VF517_03285 [Thermoleophilaceae bacterium]|jgi:hypothetical protein
MQLRRGLLTFALVLVAVSLGAALAAPDEEGEPATTTPQRTHSSTPNASVVTLRHPVEARAPVRRVRSGAHVVLRVTAGTAGSVEIPGLGLLEPVAPGSPATFDLLASPGRHQVVLVTAGGERIPLGTLAVGD